MTTNNTVKNTGEPKQSIRELQFSLNKLGNQRNELVKKLDFTSSLIKSLIKENKSLRNERDGLTKNVKELKEKRKQVHDSIKEVLKESDKFSHEKNQIKTKYQIKGDPSNIKSNIDSLQQKFETEVFSFEKEQKLMKQIHDLEKQYKEAQKISNIWEQLHNVRMSLDELRYKANSVHSEIQKKAKESQKRHELIVENSKKIEDLKKDFDSCILKLEETDIEIDAVSKKLEGVLELFAGEQFKRKEKQAKHNNQKRARDEYTLKQKIFAVKEKIKKKEKLTTEDLLILQAEN
ncbi:hypothetical protein HYV79_03665 [Candidatus Woesearchaeota archaeon]|nr:hypothetical protein [Candidatus Woesearchaeota archaeon]